jgi:hypothetical protein
VVEEGGWEMREAAFMDWWAREKTSEGSTEEGIPSIERIILFAHAAADRLCDSAVGYGLLSGGG